jgi:hypothetical protein
MAVELTLEMAQPCLKKLNAIQQRADRLAYWIRHQVMLEIDPPACQSAPFMGAANDPTRNSNDSYIRRNIRNNDRIRTNARAGPNCDWPKNLGATPDKHTIFKSWMTFARLPRRAAERNAMVKRHVVSYDGRFTYHDTSAVINKETTANSRAWMDIDVGHQPAEPRNETRGKPQVSQPEPVGDPIPDDRMNAWICNERLERITRSGITRTHAMQILRQKPPQRLLRLGAFDWDTIHGSCVAHVSHF